MLKFYTAGESHGQALLAFVSGLPAALPVDLEFINRELHRRQLGYGRGGRQKIEKDRADIFAGVRHGKTIGAPVAIRIENRDWINWEKILPVEASAESAGNERRLLAPRPGHADLAGAQKFNFHDARYVLERASARETAARVAAGALAKLLIRELGTEIASHTIQVGHVRLDRVAKWNEIHSASNDLESPLRCVDDSVQKKMMAEVDAALKAGDTVGGIFEVVARNVPVGLGSHAQWGEKLDGRLLWERSPGRNFLRQSCEAIPAVQQPRWRARGRHYQRRGRNRSRLFETNLHVAPRARHRRHGYQGAGARRL
jgi:chorismate synthase